MSIDKSTVARVATLARLRVADEEIDGLTKELSGILDFIEQLNEVNVDGVEPLTSVARLRLPMRDDVVNDGGHPEKILANGPQAAEAFFSVPKVVE